MEINIGIRDGGAPVQLDVDMTADALVEYVKHKIADDDTLEFTGSDGARVLVPIQALGYLKIAKAEQHRVGFGFV
ncbi:MAG: DUF3107 domain-containing protein [Actinomycetaceae bacterium]|nr:DUF3107 domain-containing protein [Arcanobacterium sp.]MDD7686780.1 DUF3107 domain-containing protein [Actinomycetaceae bacterium]MDY5272631.1 DUF3107 domain-containing protein [Arcanobacterium sp.]